MEEMNQWRRCPCFGQQQGLPFYMTWPAAGYWTFNSPEEENAVMRDLEYMIQMYPKQAKLYQEKISAVLDTMDYQGSVIYDEYPDRLALFRIAEHLHEDLITEEMSDPEKQFVRELILVLLYYEIFRRRRSIYSGGAGYYGRTGGIMSWPQNNPGNPWNQKRLRDPANPWNV
jgi:hypothetical protein